MSEEVFEIYEKDGVTKSGLAPRSQVHATGLYHRSVHVFVYNSAGELLIQKRMPNKDTEGGKWDLSCAEHLVPEESFEQAAARGLAEELGIDVKEAKIELKQILPMHFQSFAYPDSDRLDNEFVETFAVYNYDGLVIHDGVEVESTQFIEVSELKKRLREEPQQFTKWFQSEMKHIEQSSA